MPAVNGSHQQGVVMSKKTKKQVVWEWVAPGALILVAALLVEISHLSQGWWRYPLDMLGWGVISLGFFEPWRRWRRAEIELIRRVWLSQGDKPRISLLTGQDLVCGMPVVVNDRGFVVTPDKSPYPPPANPTWVAGSVDDEDDDVPPVGDGDPHGAA